MKKIMLVLMIVFVLLGIVFFALWAFGWGKYVSSFQVLLMFFVALGMFCIYIVYYFFFENKKNNGTVQSLSNIQRIIEIWKTLGGEILTYTDGKCKTRTFITEKGEEITFSGYIFEKHNGALIQVIYNWKKNDIYDWDDNPSVDVITNPLFEFVPFENVGRQKERKNDKIELVRPKDDEEDRDLVDEGKFKRDE